MSKHSRPIEPSTWLKVGVLSSCDQDRRSTVIEHRRISVGQKCICGRVSWRLAVDLRQPWATFGVERLLGVSLGVEAHKHPPPLPTYTVFAIENRCFGRGACSGACCFLKKKGVSSFKIATSTRASTQPKTSIFICKNCVLGNRGGCLLVPGHVWHGASPMQRSAWGKPPVQLWV